ncbi:MAG: sensor histidine kinase, partial [Bacteroidota bacterium]|nr:sensor histidine kinase [Bacteroidota bacterium]
KDENVKEIFRETQSRINSMSLIHEKLYEFNDFSKIDYYDYIKELVSQIVNTYDSVRKNLDIKIDIDKIYLNIDTAIPLGLIINELITNSIKYAFNKDEKGEIILSLSKNNDFLTFSVKDNGKGLPQNFNINNIQSLGLRLVNSLTNQIGGELLINNINGVEFIVNFKEIIKRNNIQ